MENNNIEIIGKLIEFKTKYNLLIDYLINNATLNYSKTELDFSSIERIVRALEPEKYDAKFDELKRNKEI